MLFYIATTIPAVEANLRNAVCNFVSEERYSWIKISYNLETPDVFKGKNTVTKSPVKDFVNLSSITMQRKQKPVFWTEFVIFFRKGSYKE